MENVLENVKYLQSLPQKDYPDLKNIVLFGETGVGKSYFANALTGSKMFKSAATPSGNDRKSYTI